MENNNTTGIEVDRLGNHRCAENLTTTYRDDDGNEADLTCGSVEELAAQLPEDYDGPRLEVRDEQGFVRGWIGGRNDWRAQ